MRKPEIGSTAVSLLPLPARLLRRETDAVTTCWKRCPAAHRLFSFQPRRTNRVWLPRRPGPHLSHVAVIAIGRGSANPKRFDVCIAPNFYSNSARAPVSIFHVNPWALQRPRSASPNFPSASCSHEIFFHKSSLSRLGPRLGLKNTESGKSLPAPGICANGDETSF